MERSLVAWTTEESNAKMLESGILEIVGDQAVADVDDAFGGFGDFVFVGDHDDGDAEVRVEMT
jgi:hypothetical protein